MSGVTKPKLNVQSFPRPPLLEKAPGQIRITWNNREVVSTNEAYWVLETHHPPTYYIPRSAIKAPFTLSPLSRSTYCEWKGSASYWSLKDGETGQEESGKIWSYEKPNDSFGDIKGHLAFYSNGVPWKCYVDGEEVEPQPGDFYGGWKTSDIAGIVKGGPGTYGW